MASLVGMQYNYAAWPLLDLCAVALNCDQKNAVPIFNPLLNYIESRLLFVIRCPLVQHATGRLNYGESQPLATRRTLQAPIHETR